MAARKNGLPRIATRSTQHALYEKLDTAVLPCFFAQRERYLGIMRNAIALNASFFNTQRMLLQYLYAAYVEHGEDCR